MLLMESQPLLRTQSALPRFGIVAVYLAQCLQHVTALLGKVLGYFYKLSATVRQTSGEQDRYASGELRDIAGQGVGHLDQRRQLRHPPLSQRGQTLARMGRPCR